MPSQHVTTLTPAIRTVLVYIYKLDTETTTGFGVWFRSPFRIQDTVDWGHGQNVFRSSVCVFTENKSITRRQLAKRTTQLTWRLLNHSTAVNFELIVVIWYSLLSSHEVFSLDWSESISSNFPACHNKWTRCTNDLDHEWDHSMMVRIILTLDDIAQCEDVCIDKAVNLSIKNWIVHKCLVGMN